MCDCKAMHGVCIYDIYPSVAFSYAWVVLFFREYFDLYSGDIIMDLKSRAKKLKSDIPAIFLALKDKETPKVAKILAAATIAYALSPVDLIPDFIPVLVYLDDLIILPALIAWCIKCIPGEVFADCRSRAEGMWGNGKPEKWYYAIPFVLIWVVLIAIIVIAFI